MYRTPRESLKTTITPSATFLRAFRDLLLREPTPFKCCSRPRLPHRSYSQSSKDNQKRIQERSHPSGALCRNGVQHWCPREWKYSGARRLYVGQWPIRDSTRPPWGLTDQPVRLAQQCRREVHASLASPQELAVTIVDTELESVVDDELLAEEGIADEKLPKLEAESTFRLTRHLSAKHRSKRLTHEGDSFTAASVANLQRQLTSGSDNPSAIWKLYSAIPEPRMKYISDEMLADLLTHVRRIHIRTPEAKLHYFTIMNDMVQSGIKLTLRDFNSSLVWVGRSYGTDRKAGLRKAIRIFRNMEENGRYRADVVTFNTMGDMALSAGEPEIAMDMLVEMQKRGLQPDRYTHMLSLRYSGMIGDVNAVKDAYRTMIASGQIVDTIALNCLIKALLQSDDLFTAEKILGKMKSMDAQKTSKVVPFADWQGQRKLGHILKFAAHELRNHGTLKSQMQERTPIAPNSHTYRLLIYHHTNETGNLDRIMDLLAEMLSRGLQITAPIYFIIFRGFQKNGDTKFSAWRLWSLRRIFDLFIFQAEWLQNGRGSVVDDRVQENRLVEAFDVRLIEAVIRAFGVYGSTDLTKSIWARIQEFWTPQKEWVEKMDDLASKDAQYHLAWRDRSKLGGTHRRTRRT